MDADEIARLYTPTHPRLHPVVTAASTPVDAPSDDPGDPVLENTGVMIALYPPEDVADQLAIDPAQGLAEELEDVTDPGAVEDADDLHLTLLYLGKIGEEFPADPAAMEQLAQTVATWAQGQAPVDASASGVGVFKTPDGPATYVSVDSTQLPGLRASLLNAVLRAGVTPVLNHGFSPHITIAWGDRRDVPLPSVDMRFDMVSVVIGDSRFDYPLSGGGVPEAVVARLLEKARARVIERERPVDAHTTSGAPAGADGSPAWSFTTTVGTRTVATTAASTMAPDWAGPLSTNPHMLWIQGRFVGAETPNRNGAFWATSDLEMGLPSVSYGPLNWLHEERHIIGAIADSRLIPAKTGYAQEAAREQAAATNDPHITVAANVWRWVYPEEAAVIEMASDAGRLAASMECISERVGCIGPNGCGQEYSFLDYNHGRTCAHLAERGNTRRLINPTFLGGAVIVPPSRPGWADADMRAMAAVKEQAGDAYDQAGRPDIPANTWEQIVAGAVQYALGGVTGR